MIEIKYMSMQICLNLLESYITIAINIGLYSENSCNLFTSIKLNSKYGLLLEKLIWLFISIFKNDITKLHD